MPAEASNYMAAQMLVKLNLHFLVADSRGNPCPGGHSLTRGKSMTVFSRRSGAHKKKNRQHRRCDREL
jgi:hypothetical protein